MASAKKTVKYPETQQIQLDLCVVFRTFSDEWKYILCHHPSPFSSFSKKTHHCWEWGQHEGLVQHTAYQQKKINKRNDCDTFWDLSTFYWSYL